MEGAKRIAVDPKTDRLRKGQEGDMREFTSPNWRCRCGIAAWLLNSRPLAEQLWEYTAKSKRPAAQSVALPKKSACHTLLKS
jgi:hypothetical protein